VISSTQRPLPDNTQHSQQTSMPSVGVEPPVSAGERPQTYALDRATTSLISNLMHIILIYLHIIHLLKSSTYFERYPALLQEVYVVIVYMQPLESSLSARDCLVHRLNLWYRHSLQVTSCVPINRCTRQSPAESDDTRSCIYTITTLTS
jgi:hypothetical protein